MPKVIIGKQDALVVIDAQNDFVSPKGKLYVAGVRGESTNKAIVAGIKKLSYKPFGHRTSTKDAHPRGHIEFSIFGEHCLSPGSGCEFISPLRDVLQYADEILSKGQHRSLISYSVAMSPFFGNHIAMIRALDIGRIFVCGWAYTHCVGESAIAYACQGFETILIRDLTRSVPPPFGDPEKMARKLELYGVKEINLADIDLTT